MIPSRRQLLFGVGGLGLAALGVRAWQQGLLGGGNPALAAWDEWGSGRQVGALKLVGAAVLAASPHNTQPWSFAVGRMGVDIFEVPGRNLGAMDPFGRERLAGLGAAIHNMALASTAAGRAARVKLLPDSGNPAHVARVVLGPDGSGPAPHPLLPFIGRRHTHRGPWRGGPVTEAKLAAVLDFPAFANVRVALFTAASPRGGRFAAITADATAAIVADSAMMAQSHRWMRHDHGDATSLKDGLTIATSGVSPWLATAAALLPEQSAASEGQYWLANTVDHHLPTASLFGLILTPNPHDRRSALLVGSAWQRLHLNATAAGLVAQPLNQLPEIIDREAQLGQPARFARAADALLDDPNWRPSFAFRLGQADAPARPALRRPVSDVIGPPARMEWEVEQWRAAGGAF
jgi:nitroreductase